MILDTKTAYFFLFFSNWLMTLSMLFTVGRRFRPGEAMWTGSLFVQGLGLLVIAARGAVALEVSIVAGNTLVAASLSMAYLAVSRLFARPAPLAAALLPVIAEVACVSIYLDDSNVRILFNGLINCGQEALILQVLLRRGPIGVGGRPLLIMAGGYMAAMLVFAWRAFYASSMPAYAGTSFPPNVVDTWTAVVGFAGIIATGFGMILMHREFVGAEIERLATLDSLTGIFNRRMLMDLADRAVATARRSGRPLALLMLDLDEFKRVNDRYGHQAGDQVLIGFVKCVLPQTRPQDVFGRYGGEEFCVVLPDTDAAGVEAVAGRIRLAVEQNEVAFGNDRIRITASIGIAVAEESAELSLDQLLSAADSALYQAKGEGRNRLHINRLESLAAAEKLAMQPVS